MNYSLPKSVLIVGGGTAGWMAANIFLHAWGVLGTKVTLIESSDVGIIGVGEGSTPALRKFFSYLKIAEKDWMPACNATYKSGIQFNNWSTKVGFEHYFHPFYAASDVESSPAFFHNVNLRRAGWDAPAHPNAYFLSTQLARENKAPISINQDAFNQVEYGYHFDSALLGKYLATHAKKMGLVHIVDHIQGVTLSDVGEIASVQAKELGSITADFYVDCTGFAGLLMDKALKEPFIAYKESLFNNAAVTIATDINPNKIPVATISTALSSGWAWKIPLTNRYGNGYVYSNDFITAEEAEQELRRHLGATANNASARHLKMRVGRIENHWKKNCLAVGLSQGFIEPLEATALALVQSSLEKFVDVFDNPLVTPEHIQRYNANVNALFEGVKDYIVTHYVLNSRTDTDYWNACRNDTIISDSLASLLNAWQHGSEFEKEYLSQGRSKVYCAESWFCILAGMGCFPESVKSIVNSDTLAPVHYYISKNQKLSEEFFLAHAHYLNQRN